MSTQGKGSEPVVSPLHCPALIIHTDSESKIGFGDVADLLISDGFVPYGLYST